VNVVVRGTASVRRIASKIELLNAARVKHASAGMHPDGGNPYRQIDGSIVRFRRQLVEKIPPTGLNRADAAHRDQKVRAR